jgi:putative holliday junction resolvase
MGHRDKTFIALDVGEKRIGVATASTAVRIAIPLTTIEVDGNEIHEIAKIVADEDVDTIVVGYPRNQSGEATAQTAYVEAFTENIKDMTNIAFQDESLTSVMAENQLKTIGGSYTKGDIDARAAAIILQDYLELHS